ncbi:LLM class flavin-dependent oxidoreductase [Paenibacillus sp. EPM92]|uniref:LLM class flavin-dependent oxidoreductase n=1 Tax=Paenibacillus sp. EPM92 TaxID=1561195 RepID=UPI001916072D|nr:LLM class flavin-dependent oxidoreductase [Paenibacillus sp. EPM92]
MKFIYVNIMPYRDLPEDFVQNHESVWVTIPSELYDAEKGHLMFNEYVDQYEIAVDAGFDAVGFNEHHGNAYGLDNSLNIMAAMLARKVRQTEKTCIVLIGDSIALYNPPIRVAEELAMLDNITGGRVVAGFPAGTSMDTNYVYGIPPAELRPRFYEALDLIKQAWTRSEVFPFNGKYTQLKHVNLWPRPYQKPHPPIWLPGSGSVETWDYCAKNDLPYYYLSYSGYATAKKFMDGFWEHRQKLGKDLNPYWAGFNQVILVSETDERAQQDYEEHLRYMLRTLMHIPAKYAEAPGYRTARSVAESLVSQFALHGKSRYSTKTDFDWKQIVEAGNVIAGSPATVRDRLREMIKSLRVGNITAHLNIGSMPHHLAVKNIELFSKEVMPYLHDIWDDQWPVVGWPEVANNRLNHAGLAQNSV